MPRHRHEVANKNESDADLVMLVRAAVLSDELALHGDMFLLAQVIAAAHDCPAISKARSAQFVRKA